VGGEGCAGMYVHENFCFDSVTKKSLVCVRKFVYSCHLFKCYCERYRLA
jgi:hypothetical protein